MQRLLQGQKIFPTLIVDPLVLAQEFGKENFPKGYVGTPATGTTGAATFNAVQLPDQRIQVTGSVTALAYLAELFGVNQVAVNATGVARKNEVEIMLVLDRSGSMGFNGGKPIADLKTAATSFIGFFKYTEDTDKVGLISFATGVTVDVPLGNNFVKPMTKAIDKMNAIGGTNAEDALAHTMGPGGLADQTGVAPDKRVQESVIFFTGRKSHCVQDYARGQRYRPRRCGGVRFGPGSPTCDTVFNNVVNGNLVAQYADPNTGRLDKDTRCRPADGLPTKILSVRYTTNTHWNIFDTISPGRRLSRRQLPHHLR